MATYGFISVAVLLAIGGGAAFWFHKHRMDAENTSLTKQIGWYQGALRNAGVGVWQWDLRTDQWRWIEGDFQIHGSSVRYRVGIGEDFFANIHPDDRERVLAVERECMQGEYSVRNEYRYRIHTGEYRWLRDIGDVVTAGREDSRLMMGITMDVTVEKEHVLAHERRSGHDDLTGLPNRRTLIEHVEARMAHGEEAQRFCVGFLDLNGFKLLNDTYGHAAGDRCLQEIGLAFRALLNEGELAARIGGDEFVVIMPAGANGRTRASRRMEKLIQAMLDRVQVVSPGERLGAAIGLSLYPDHGATASQLLDAADQAMYEAKASRRRFAMAAYETPRMLPQRLMA